MGLGTLEQRAWLVDGSRRLARSESTSWLIKSDSFTIVNAFGTFASDANNVRGRELR